MLTYISAHPTAAVEIATGPALAMTVVVGGWSFCIDRAMIVT